MANRIIILFFLILAPRLCLAAACCAGGGSSANLILGDYRWQYSLAFSNKAITHDVDSQEVLQKRNKDSQEVIESLKLLSAYQIAPRFQLGVAIEGFKQTYKTTQKNESSTGLASLSFSGSFEFLPEYGHHPWKPRGFIYLSHLLAQAKSTYESDKIYQTDAASDGMNKSSLGLYFFKVFFPVDVAFNAELSWHHPRKIAGKTVAKDFSNQISISLGHSPKGSSLRYGLDLSRSYQGKTKVDNQYSASKTYSAFGINLSYLWDQQSFKISYNDQTLIGAPRNTKLGKSLALSVTRFTYL